MKPKLKHHKSQQAFLEWWLTPHYETAAFTDYKGWEIINNPKELGIESDLLKGNENIYHVLTWDKYNWYLILSQENKKNTWLVQMPQNIWSPLDTTLSYELSIDSISIKYTDITEASVNFYWCEGETYPLIEFITNHPAYVPYYLYIWNAKKHVYVLHNKRTS
ncbi:MAG: hypothetical protein KJ620_10050 [Candidatus Edwardsbacteria bacterium]|nr:hypothetical protein [Candidatus Edwardsbacteria bacterium]MBU1577406.1 hypothetical protein [Candidatus Edwardsbacteria bacterium]MBU2462792.1 hypothetical protein [Candidatus Edwardsbacteria bacterium]MBU2592973.1 hypothetical protein [Candidatus Edwardsbacteria bacterium]